MNPSKVTRCRLGFRLAAASRKRDLQNPIPARRPGLAGEQVNRIHTCTNCYGTPTRHPAKPVAVCPVPTTLLLPSPAEAEHADKRQAGQHQRRRLWHDQDSEKLRSANAREGI